MDRKTIRAYAGIIGSMLIFGTIGIFRRYIPLSSGLLALTRGLLGCICLCLFQWLRGEKVFHGIGTGKVLLMLLTGGIMGFNWILLFEAYRYTTVAVATLCYYMQPTILILLSPLAFRERLTLKRCICAALAVIGMVLVSGVTGGTGIGDIRGVMLGLGAAVLYAMVIVFNKKVPVESPYERTILELMGSAAMLLPYLLLTEDFTKVTFTSKALLMLLVVGIIHTGFAYALYFGCMDRLKAQSIAVLSYIDPVFALLLSFALLGEKMSFGGIIGAILIIGSALVSELPDRKITSRKSDLI